MLWNNIGLINLSIYNRWGQGVYQTDTLSAGWEGKEATEGL